MNSFSQESENFDVFYEKFYKDTIFQQQRIKFPLQGCETLSKKEIGLPFTVENKLNNIKDPDYTIEVVKTSTEYSCKAYIPDSTFILMAKFKIINGKWYLYYYYSSFLEIGDEVY